MNATWPTASTQSPAAEVKPGDAYVQSFARGLEVNRTPPRQMQETMLEPLRAAAREIAQRLVV